MKMLRTTLALAAVAAVCALAACSDATDQLAPTSPSRSIVAPDSVTPRPQQQESSAACDSTAVPGTFCRDSGGTIGGGG